MLVILKLRDGDYVMGTMSVVDNDIIRLSNALIMNQFMYSDEPALQFIKYCVYTHGFDVDFDKKDIMHIFKDPSESIVGYYNKQLPSVKAFYRKQKLSAKDKKKIEKENELYDAMIEKYQGKQGIH